MYNHFHQKKKKTSAMKYLKRFVATFTTSTYPIMGWDDYEKLPCYSYKVIRAIWDGSCICMLAINYQVVNF